MQLGKRKERTRSETEEDPSREILVVAPPAHPSLRLTEVSLFSLYVPIEEGRDLPLWQAQNILCVSHGTGKSPSTILKILLMDLTVSPKSLRRCRLQVEV